MGITGLAKLIADFAPNAIKENEIKNHFGKLLFSSKQKVLVQITKLLH